jgi:adenylate cyclase class 2
VPLSRCRAENLELKALDRDRARSVQICEGLGADDEGTLIQRDSYFEVPRGRLKLREEPGAGAYLIAYDRPDLPGSKESRYRLIEVGEPVKLREALAAVLGIRVVVSKARRLFVFEGVRIHLDRVDGLGDFIEFEGVRADGGDPGCVANLLNDLRGSFGLRDEDLLRESYSDLLDSRSTSPAVPECSDTMSGKQAQGDAGWPECSNASDVAGAPRKAGAQTGKSSPL